MAMLKGWNTANSLLAFTMAMEVIIRASGWVVERLASGMRYRLCVRIEIEVLFWVDG